MWDDSERWMERGGAPPVETWCLFGTGEPEAGGQAVVACITSPLEAWCLFRTGEAGRQLRHKGCGPLGDEVGA